MMIVFFSLPTAARLPDHIGINGLGRDHTKEVAGGRRHGDEKTIF